MHSSIESNLVFSVSIDIGNLLDVFIVDEVSGAAMIVVCDDLDGFMTLSALYRISRRRKWHPLLYEFVSAPILA